MIVGYQFCRKTTQHFSNLTQSNNTASYNNTLQHLSNISTPSNYAAIIQQPNKNNKANNDNYRCKNNNDNNNHGNDNEHTMLIMLPGIQRCCLCSPGRTAWPRDPGSPDTITHYHTVEESVTSLSTPMSVSWLVKRYIQLDRQGERE